MKQRILALLVVTLLALTLCSCKTAQKKYAIGETWTVDGQWSLTVTSVTETADRSDLFATRPEAVYIVEYTYTNIGYEDTRTMMDGLFFSLDESIVDSTGAAGYSYPVSFGSYPRETPIGESCTAQVCVGVDHAGDFKLNVAMYDGTGTEQTATFAIKVN